MKLVWNGFLFPQSSWFLTDRWLLNIISLQIWKLSSSIHSMTRTIGAFYFFYFNTRYNKFAFFQSSKISLPYYSLKKWLNFPGSSIWPRQLDTCGVNTRHCPVGARLPSPQSQAFGQVITGLQRCVKRSETLLLPILCLPFPLAPFHWSSSWIFYNLWTFSLLLSVSPTRPISFCVLVFWLWRANLALFLFSLFEARCVFQTLERKCSAFVTVSFCHYN